jgi:hypothetical protein
MDFLKEELEGQVPQLSFGSEGVSNRWRKGDSKNFERKRSSRSIECYGNHGRKAEASNSVKCH